MTIALGLIVAAVAALVVRGRHRARNERRRAEYRERAQKRSRMRRTPYLL